ncbi:hypothetical protein ACE939_07460 [Aquimarina sp. W85]|uniref:hypothetical protein n=1 Tax=Aquimarina rhodophyticola TaxID=3342246 RepID=UPI00366B9F19
MKYIFFLVISTILLSYNPVYAQRSTAILTYKDGKQLIGLGKIRASGKIKFKKEKKDKAQDFSFDSIARATIHEPYGMVHYVQRRVRGTNTYVVVELVKQGVVTLYRTYDRSYRTMRGEPDQFGSGFVTSGSAPIKNYYVHKEGEIGITHLGSNQIFSKNFKKVASAYFKDCPVLVNKIETREYRKRDVKEILSFYIEHCAVGGE